MNKITNFEYCELFKLGVILHSKKQSVFINGTHCSFPTAHKDII